LLPKLVYYKNNGFPTNKSMLANLYKTKKNDISNHNAA